MSRPIRISDDVHRHLLANQRPGESMDSVLTRLLIRNNDHLSPERLARWPAHALDSTRKKCVAGAEAAAAASDLPESQRCADAITRIDAELARRSRS